MTASGQYRSFQGFPWSLNCIYSNTPSQELEGLNSGDRVVPDSSSLVSGKGFDPPRARKVMGRGKIEIKKIENPTSRQVTFSKRRGGLMKKGHELAVLCDAEVAVIIFSSAGKMFEFASSGSMRNILERYSKCPDGAQIGVDCDFMGREMVMLRQQVERLQESQRHMLGENLQGLTIPDLLQMEHQLDTSASRVRARKNQLLLEEVEDLRRKEKAFLAANEDLRQKLADVKKMTEAAAPAGTSEGPSQLVASIPPQYEAGGSSSQPAVTLYPAVHPNLRDPQTSQTSLHLGLFPESLIPSTSRRTSQQSPTEQGESSMRWEHPHYRSQQ